MEALIQRLVTAIEDHGIGRYYSGPFLVRIEHGRVHWHCCHESLWDLELCPLFFAGQVVVGRRWKGVWGDGAIEEAKLLLRLPGIAVENEARQRLLLSRWVRWKGGPVIKVGEIMGALLLIASQRAVQGAELPDVCLGGLLTGVPFGGLIESWSIPRCNRESTV